MLDASGISKPALKRFALDLRQVLFEISAQNSDFERFLETCVIQVFKKAL